jgi:hypothetical protein
MSASYGGIKMRSLLETRWAAFFDLAGWKWSYEPPIGNGYLPDFLIMGQAPMLVEIRPVVLRKAYEREIATMCVDRDQWPHDLVLLGVDPLGLVYEGGRNYAGLIGEFGAYGKPNWSWDAALWSVCENCGVLGLVHSTATFYGRPCGCYDGDHFLNFSAGKDRVSQLWPKAMNLTRWEPRAHEENR